MRNKFQGLIIIFLCFLLLLALTPAIIIITYHIVFAKKIYPYVAVNNINLAGKSKNEALEIINNQISHPKDGQPLAENIKYKPLKFKFDDKTWEINPKDLDLKYLPEETFEKAYLVGRSGNFKNNLLAKWTIWKKKVSLGLEFEIDGMGLNEQIASISAQIEKPAIPPTIKIINQKVEIQPGVEGKQLNKPKLLKLINHKISYTDFSQIELPVENILSKVTPAEIEKTRQRAEKFLAKSVKLSFNKNAWTTGEEELINFISFKNEFDEIKIASYSAFLAQSIDHPAQNALFNFSNGRVLEFKPAHDGQTLDQKKTTQLIKKALGGLEKDEQNKIATVSLPVSLTKPLIATDQVNNLGIKELIGRGESWFWGSAAERIHNIKLATSNLNGVLITPGEIFSFNKAVGDISAQTGFKQAYIIKEGRTVLGDGGGVCQVSTTLFRAVLDAGLPIEERRAHAYRVYYYEQNYQVGVDATVFNPTADLKFKNDTPAHILIQTYTNPSAAKLTFELYGASDDRVSTISKSRIWDQKSPPPDLYQDDPSLPAGTIKQVDWRAWGAKVSFDWKVVRGNDTLQKKTFYSNYRPWQAIFLRGTGG